MKLSKQLISFLLVIVMIIGLLPYSAFANTNLTNTTDPGNNGETGYEDQGTGGSGTATWSIPGRDYWGVRFSLYFSEDKTGKGNFEPVGKTIDTCMTSFGYTPNRASMWNVFDRMNGKMNEFGFNVVDYGGVLGAGQGVDIWTGYTLNGIALKEGMIASHISYSPFAKCPVTGEMYPKDSWGKIMQDDSLDPNNKGVYGEYEGERYGYGGWYAWDDIYKEWVWAGPVTT